MAAKWSPQFEVEGMAISNGRYVAIPKMMVPLMQTDNSMLFTDIRTRWDNRDSQEVNIGLGYREVINDEWILGGYAFFDYLDSQFDNQFMQATLGVEALSEAWDVRSNVYIPEADEKPTGGGQLVFTDTTIGLRGSLERALPGFDGEVGYRLPIDGIDDLRIYGGGYYYYADEYDMIAGPRGRVEWTVTEADLAWLSDGKEITFGAGFQYDDIRKEQSFALLELRIPFGSSGKQSRNRSPLDKRMMRFIERDLDVVSSDEGKVEPVIVNGQTRSEIVRVDATDDIVQSVANAAETALILVDGSLGNIEANNRIEMRQGQMMAGGGTPLVATGARSGITFATTAPGTRPTIVGSAIGSLITVRGNSVLTNITTQANSGINAFGDNIVISDIDVTMEQSTGISVSGSNIIVKDSTVTDTGTGTCCWAVWADDGDVTMSNLTINNAVNDALRVDSTRGSVHVSNVTINNPQREGVSVDSSFDTQVNTFTDITINNAGRHGVEVAQAELDHLAFNNVVVNGAANHAFSFLDGRIDSLTGTGNQANGTIGGSACNRSRTLVDGVPFGTSFINGSFSFTDNSTCP